MRQELTNKIILQMKIEGETGALPVVSPDCFFIGNCDTGSIGCNLFPHPGISTFYKILKSIELHEEVQNIYIEIYEFEEHSDWPFSERCYILSSLDKQEIRSLLQDIHPSDISEGWEYGKPKLVPPLNENVKVYSIWWD